MAFSQRGIQYDGRSEIDPGPIKRALDQIASQLQAGLRQVQATPHGTTSPPSPPAGLEITSDSGFAHVRIQHMNPPPGVAYILEYSTSPQFVNPVRVDNGISTSWQQNLTGQRVYFRAATTFYTSPLSAWTYFGSAASPQAVQF